MVNMQLNNEKLRDRGIRMLMEKINMQDYDAAKNILEQYGSVKKAVDAVKKAI
jgi:N-acetylmuramic acid 6-phosphate etherase